MDYQVSCHQSKRNPVLSSTNLHQTFSNPREQCKYRGSKAGAERQWALSMCLGLSGSVAWQVASQSVELVPLKASWGWEGGWVFLMEPGCGGGRTDRELMWAFYWFHLFGIHFGNAAQHKRGLLPAHLLQAPCLREFGGGGGGRAKKRRRERMTKMEEGVKELRGRKGRRST